MAVVQDFKHLVVLRILVGVFEAGFAPGILLIISSWYKKEEQSKRFGVYMSAAILSGAFGGLLAGAITGGMDGTGGLRGWRWLFIVEGAATIVWAICASFILLDFPANSKRLTERERAIAIARLRGGGVQTHVEGQERMGKGQSFKLAIMDWRTIGFILGYMVRRLMSINTSIMQLTYLRSLLAPPHSPTSTPPSSTASATNLLSKHNT
jgi:MFS family permease